MGINLNVTRDDDKNVKIGKKLVRFSKMDSKQIFLSFLLLHHQEVCIQINFCIKKIS